MKDLESDTVQGAQGVKKGNPAFKLRYKDLQPGTTYKITIATTYDTKEVAESYFEFTTRPVAPTGEALQTNTHITSSLGPWGNTHSFLNYL